MSERPENHRLLVWAIVASHFGPPFMFSGVAVGLPSLGADVGADATGLGLVETMFLAGSMAFLLPAGRLADAADKRRLFEWGVLVFGLVSLAIGLSSSLAWILALRLLQGAASAVFAATGPALLADLVPAHRRGAAYGASMGAVYAGLTAGPFAAGALVERWSWRAVFLAGGLLLLLLGALVAWRMSARWRRPARGAVHWPSAGLVSVAVLAAILGGAELDRGLVGVSLLALAALAAVAFVVVQLRVPRPLLDLRELFRNGPLAVALLVQLLLYMNAYCSMFLLSLFLQQALGASPAVAGRVLATGSVLMAVVAPLSGRLADRLRPRPVACAGIAAVVASSLLGMRLHSGASLSEVAVVLAAQGLGFGLFSTPNMALIMGSAPAGSSGMASALSAKARSIGMVAGMVLTSGMLALDLGDAAIAQAPERFVGAMTTVWTVLACTACAALLVALAVRPRSPVG